MKYQANPVIVEAVVITSVLPHGTHGTDDSGELYLVTAEGSDVVASAEMLARIKPVPGDYVVTQADGYVYLNPKDIFERKYSPVPDSADKLVFGRSMFGVDAEWGNAQQP